MCTKHIQPTSQWLDDSTLLLTKEVVTQRWLSLGQAPVTKSSALRRNLGSAGMFHQDLHGILLRNSRDRYEAPEKRSGVPQLQSACETLAGTGLYKADLGDVSTLAFSVNVVQWRVAPSRGL